MTLQLFFQLVTGPAIIAAISIWSYRKRCKEIDTIVERVKKRGYTTIRIG